MVSTAKFILYIFVVIKMENKKVVRTPDETRGFWIPDFSQSKAGCI